MQKQRRLFLQRKYPLLDQYINLFGELKTFIPWVSFIAGLGGSLHCVGMCGGLVTATCEKSSDIFRYQLGRLLGYLFLGVFAGHLGSLLNMEKIPPQIALLPSLSIGLLFIFWGVQNLKGRRAEIPTPKFFRDVYSLLWVSLVRNNKTFTKSFFTGLISILLPCGLLYGIVIGTVAFQDTIQALLSMAFFWLGTVPSMVAAPGVTQKLLGPLKKALPKTYAISLILIGLLTISMRATKIQFQMDNATFSERTEKKSNDICH